MKKMSYEMRVRQKLDGGFEQSRSAIKKGIAVAVLVAAAAAALAAAPKIKSAVNRAANRAANEAVVETERRMSPLMAELENALNKMGN